MKKQVNAEEELMQESIWIYMNKKTKIGILKLTRNNIFEKINIFDYQ